MNWFPDSNWLKAHELNWHITAALFVACVVVLIGAEYDWLHLGQLSEPVQAIFAVIAILAGVLTFSHLIKRTVDILIANMKQRTNERESEVRQRKTLRYLDTLSQDEHRVLSYLVQRNQQSFAGDMTGSKIVTLKQKGLIVMGTGAVALEDAPFTVPGFVWEELQRRKDQFNSANLNGPQPWREMC